jgi:hypothetical protein
VPYLLYRDIAIAPDPLKRECKLKGSQDTEKKYFIEAHVMISGFSTLSVQLDTLNWGRVSGEFNSNNFAISGTSGARHFFRTLTFGHNSVRDSGQSPQKIETVITWQRS